MECNRDEALRAKQIAENKLQSGDFAGALKFATKAQKLFPDVQNIVQILTVCEVHCAAQNKISGSDMDWYGILQIERFADEATIKKQYRKLALLLHPDKNKSAGAEAAFKLIGEANRVLSDRAKRSFYDMKFRVPGGSTAPKFPPPHHPHHSSFEAKGNGNTRNPPNTFNSQSHSWNSHQWDDHSTFWTACQHCKTRFQYYKTVVNATLRCQQCSKNFIALDFGPQGVSPGHKRSSSNIQKEPSKHVPPKTSTRPSSMAKCNAGTTKAGAGTSNPATSKAKESQKPTNVGSKRARQSASDAGDDYKTGYANNMKNANVRENGVDPSGDHPRRSSRKKQHASCTETAQDDDFQNSSKRPRQSEYFNTIKVEKSEVPASSGLFSNNNPAGFTADVGVQNGEMRNKATVQSKETLSWNKTKAEHSDVQRKEASKSDLDDSKSKAANFSPMNSNFPPDSGIYCPDPDFSDFEKDRAEDCFAVNQLWAVFDPTDSMPRFYAIVKKVYSPFKLQITWLEADSDDPSEMDWIDSGLPVACGKFTLGVSQRTTDRYMFSHQVHCIKGSGKGPFLVYPNKGETWAIFRNWDFGWKSNPKKHSEYQYEYVEVLSDFVENVGIKVAYLGKVKGFVSLFQQTVQNGISLFYVPPNELYRFSHRIPSYKMSGDERNGVPRGSFELDPAGLPSSIFEVGGPGDKEIEHGILNNGVDCLRQESSTCKVEQAMSNKSMQKEKLHGNNDARGVSLRRSPRSSQKSMDNGHANSSHYMVREDDNNIAQKDNSEPGGNTAAWKTKEKVKTPQKHLKNNYERETLEVRRSPRDLSKKSAQGEAGEWKTGKLADIHPNKNKNVKDGNFSQLGGSFKKDCRAAVALCFDLKKEKSEEVFQCDQIWAIYGDRDNMPGVYAQIKKIDRTPNFRLHVSVLEPCSPSKGSKGTISCGIFKVKNGKLEILPVSAFSHQLIVEPTANNRYEIYPRKGEIWALYKDQNYDPASSNKGRDDFHITEVLAEDDRSIKVVVLTPLSSTEPIFKAPRIQRSKTGIIEVSREDIGRFSHRIPAFQRSGEDENVNFRGCWELDPSSIPGFVIQLD